MKHEIEIEYKQLLTQKEFDTLVEFFNIIDTDFICQTNYYLDTASHMLLNNMKALRIRQVNDQYTLTLKERLTDDVINEYHEMVDKSQLDDLSFESSEIFDRINVNYQDIQIVGKLCCHRAILHCDNYVLFFDRNEYDDYIDYEIEMEVSSVDDEHYFDAILEKFNIEKTKTLPKIARALAYKK